MRKPRPSDTPCGTSAYSLTHYLQKDRWSKTSPYRTIRTKTIRYDTIQYITCTQKLTKSQLYPGMLVLVLVLDSKVLVLVLVLDSKVLVLVLVLVTKVLVLVLK